MAAVSTGVGQAAATSARKPGRSSASMSFRDRALAQDAFPYTRRPLPWVLAAFMAMLFFVPVDSTELKIPLPVGSQVDRFAIVGMVLAWVWFGGDQRAFLRTRRSKLYASAACVFLVVAVASLLLDVDRIVNVDQIGLAGKRFALLGSFLILSWFTLTALRFADIRGFASYLIGLATMMAIGMLVERHTGYSVFYNWSAALLKPIANVAPSPTNIHPVFGSDGRVTVVGPTLHGLAATTMLMVVMPFALVRVFDRTSRSSRWLNAIAFTLMLVAAASTDRKTALLVPIAVVIYLAFYRPRQVLRIAPAGLVMLLAAVHIASPGALGTIFTPSAGLGSSSTEHRESDFQNVTPDVLVHPVLGRGFGTLNSDQSNNFRINDDEYVDEIWEVGIVGLLAYMFLILAPVIAARRAIRARDPSVAPLALAASAGCVAYFVVNALFDAMSFPQAPYMFFVVAALATISSAGPAGTVEPARDRARKLALKLRAIPLAEASSWSHKAI
jgi:hypothetical protein